MIHCGHSFRIRLSRKVSWTMMDHPISQNSVARRTAFAALEPDLPVLEWIIHFGPRWSQLLEGKRDNHARAGWQRRWASRMVVVPERLCFLVPSSGCPPERSPGTVTTRLRRAYIRRLGLGDGDEFPWLSRSRIQIPRLRVWGTKHPRLQWPAMLRQISWPLRLVVLGIWEVCGARAPILPMGSRCSSNACPSPVVLGQASLNLGAIRWHLALVWSNRCLPGSLGTRG